MPPTDDRPYVGKRVRRRDDRQRTTFGNWFRFLVYVLGLTGLLAVGVGFILVAAYADYFGRLKFAELVETAQVSFRGELGPVVMVAAFLIGVGGAAVVVALLVYLLTLLFTAGRKTAVGTNATLQVALAVTLVVIVNAISFSTYWRFDRTRDRQFTLAPESVEALQKLRADSPTTVVVLQLHKTAGTLSDRPDALDSAAEKKVVEKVKDLVAELREFGPRFNVVVLDAHDERFERAVKELTRTRPGLAAAIAEAPENSIFFYADEKVRTVPRTVAEKLTRVPTAPDPADPSKSLVYSAPVARMSFTEFYQLDKTASTQATTAERDQVSPLVGGTAFAPGVSGAGNLVLIPRGKKAFVRKVLTLEERRPKVALAVIHPLLTSRETIDEFTATGLRRSLEANGFEVVDIILKRWGDAGPPTPDAATFEESDLERAAAEFNDLSESVEDLRVGLPRLTAAKAAADKALADADKATTSDERLKHFLKAREALGPVVIGRIQTEDQLRSAVARIGELIPQVQQQLAEDIRQLAEMAPRYQELLRNERTTEARRITDVKQKLSQYVADCDLLIVPRLTVYDITRPDGVIRPSIFDLSEDQADVVREFLKAGKPALFAFGPTNVDPRGGGGNPDDVEQLLPALGIELGRQVVLSDVEVRAMVLRRRQEFGVSVDVPPLSFERPEPTSKLPNPVAAAYRTTSRAVDQTLDLKVGGLRPVYPRSSLAALPYAPEIAFTTPASFNKDRALPGPDYVPKFDPTKQDATLRGTRDEERRGPFPVGVAVEVPVPIDWYDPPPDAFTGIVGGGAAVMELPARKAADEPQALAGLTGAAAPHARVPVATRMFPGFGPSITAAAFTMPFDGGLYAALVTAAERQQERPTVRVVAVGHGGMFTGNKLDPAQETLLLHTLNWQLRREDRLPKDVPDEEKWRYPRAGLTPSEFTIWRWSTFAILPLVVVYFGLITLMFRKLR